MWSSTLCRTCDCFGDTNNLNALTTPSEKYPQKVLSDLLMELSIIDTSMNNIEELPQNMCDSCTFQLKNAYNFVIQAKETQQKLVALFKSTKTNELPVLNPDCLQEIPMDVSAQELLEIKMEEEGFHEPKREIGVAKEKTLQIGNKNEHFKENVLDPLSKNEPISDSSSGEDELHNLSLKQRKLLLKKTEKPLKPMKGGTERIYKCDKCVKSYLWPQNLRIHKRTHISKEDLFVCQHCCQEFSRKESFDAHLKKHGESHTSKRPANLCERKQAKDIDINMCKPNGCKLIQCMLCLGKFTKFSQLRFHMQEHRDNVSFAERQNEYREIVESIYPDHKDLPEEEVVLRIRKDLEAGKYFLFYSITNESGYELSLDSSETESDWDADNDDLPKMVTKSRKRKSNYICELCNENYRRKYELFEHQRQKHAWLDAPHACIRCDARFVSEKLLEHHYKSQCKNSQKRLICRKCPLRFRWKHNLKAHYRDHKSKNESFECTECSRVFDNKKSLSMHMLTVHIDQSCVIPCQWCDRKFYRRDYMIKHLKRHGLKEGDLPLAEAHISATATANGAKSIKCKVCNIDFKRIADLRGHLLLELKLALTVHHSFDSMLNYSITNESGFELHIDDSESDEDEVEYINNRKVSDAYRCELCNVRSRRKFEMMQHQRAMHRFEKLPYACEQCIFKSVSKDVFEYHKSTQCSNTEKQHVCTICGYKFMWLENLETHTLLQHSDAVGSTPSTQSRDSNSNTKNKTDAKLPTLQCPHCDRTYMLQSRLNNHIRDVHVEGDRKKKEAQQKFLCSRCGKELRSAANLVTHMRRHMGEKPFKCDLCEMAFPRHCEMLGHRRRHTGEKPYHCTVCGKNFSQSHKLKRHMLTHSGLKPYKCTYCEKCYRQSKDLAIHMQQHTGQCPFACGTCGERFLQSATLKKHRMMRGHFDETQ